METQLTFMGFFASVVALPVVGQIQATTDIEKLGKGSAQFILAFGIVILGWMCVKILQHYREDMKEAAESTKDMVKETSDALAKNAEGYNNLSGSIDHLADVVANSVGAARTAAK